METETFSTKLPLHFPLDRLGALRGYGWKTKPSRIIAIGCTYVSSGSADIT